MSKWDDKLNTIRALIDIGLDSTTIAMAIGATADALRTVCKRNAITIPAGRRSQGAGMVCEIPVELLRADPDQPRQQFEEDSLAALAQSLKTEGQQSPIHFRVSDIDDDDPRPLLIVHGERRWRAAALANLPTVLGILHHRIDIESDRLLLQISDNAQRDDLTPWDWIVSIDRLHRQGLAHEQISQALSDRGIKGFSRPVVSNYCRMLKLPDSAKQLLQQGTITPAHGKYLLQCKDEAIRATTIADIIRATEENGTAPTIEQTQRFIRSQYQKTHRGLNCWGQSGSDWTQFEWQTVCSECQHRHKVDAEHVFCTNPVAECWDGNQAAAIRRDLAEREQEEQAESMEEQAIESVNLEDLKTTDPEEAERIERLRTDRDARKAMEIRAANIKAIRHQMEEVAKTTTDIDVLLVCALQYFFEDLPLPGSEEYDERVTPTQWLQHFRQARLSTLQYLAGESMGAHVYIDDLPHYASMLGLDPEGDYRQHETQPDQQEAAA